MADMTIGVMITPQDGDISTMRGVWEEADVIGADVIYTSDHFIAPTKAEREESRAHTNGSTKSKFQILYWQEIPSEVKAWDDFDEVKMSLPEKFVIRIDASAQKQGLISQDAYSAHFRWGDAKERAGSPQEVAEAVCRELAAQN